MGSTAPTEGLLYVESRIKSPPIVSIETYSKWYDEVHFPDLTSAPDGPVIALRYKHTSPSADTAGGLANATVEWPFLALYKMNDLHWLGGPGFAAIPHDHPMLPAAGGHNAWGCFDAQLRTYELLARSEVQPGTDRPKYVVTFETAVASAEKFGMMGKVYGAMSGYRGSILYQITPGIMEHEQKDLEKPGFAVTWFDEMPVIDQTKHGAVVWELVHVAGKKDGTF